MNIIKKKKKNRNEYRNKNGIKIETGYDKEYGEFVRDDMDVEFSPYYFRLNSFWFSRGDMIEIRDKINEMLEMYKES